MNTNNKTNTASLIKRKWLRLAVIQKWHLLFFVDIWKRGRFVHGFFFLARPKPCNLDFANSSKRRTLVHPLRDRQFSKLLRGLRSITLLQAMPLATKLYEAIHQTKVVICFSVSYSCILFFILGVHVSTNLKEKHGDSLMTSNGSHVQRCSLFLVLQIHISSPLNKPADCIDVVVGSGNVKSCSAFCISRVHFHAIEMQKFHEIISSVFCCNVEWCVSRECPLRQGCTTTVTKLC